MKKYTYILLLTGILGMLSCNALLNTEPEDFISPSNTFKTEAQLNYALTGVYELLSHTNLYSVNYISMIGSEADEGYYRGASLTSGPQIYSFGPSDVTVTNMWMTLYEGIGRANTVLAYINKPAMDERRRAQIKGEALFLRAYYYFLLAIHWGDVPLTLEPAVKPEGNSIPRSPLTKVYGQIVKDLTEAEPIVYPIKDLKYGGRANQSAVRGLLSRVYLHWAGYPLKDESKYEDAGYWAAKVMDPQEGHELNPSYEQVFKNYSSDKYDIKESIFEVEFWGNLVDAYHAVGRVGNVNGVQTNNEATGFAYGYIRATPKLYNLYGGGEDLRRDWAICPFYYDDNGQKVQRSLIYERSCGKFRREYEVVSPKHKLGTPINFPVIRYSDILLMFAEADNEINKAPSAEGYEALNQVRRRAYGKDPHTPDITIDISGKDYPEFQQIVREERARELCYEALRKYDLIRWGIFVREMKAVLPTLPGGVFYTAAFSNVTDRNVLFPIPTRELSLNRALTQNSGW
jgi:hypothetical protein